MAEYRRGSLGCEVIGEVEAALKKCHEEISKAQKKLDRNKTEKICIVRHHCNYELTEVQQQVSELISELKTLMQKTSEHEGLHVDKRDNKGRLNIDNADSGVGSCGSKDIEPLKLSEEETRPGPQQEVGSGTVREEGAVSSDNNLSYPTSDGNCNVIGRFHQALQILGPEGNPEDESANECSEEAAAPKGRGKQ